MPFRLFLAAASLVSMPGFATRVEAEPPVSLELITSQGFPITGHRQWMDFLKDFGFTSLRIRSGRPGEVPAVVNRGTDRAPRYYVTGVLASRDQLHLPGVAIRLGRRNELTDWLAKLRSGGAEAVTTPTGSFGLTAKQWHSLHTAMSPAVTFSTRQQPVGVVVRRIVAALRPRVDIGAEASRALAGNDVVADELRGLSSGTALAAAIRPLGLAVIPSADGPGKLVLHIRPPKKGEDYWPVGLRPEKSPGEVAPSLFKFLNAEINDQPAIEALTAIQERVAVPMLLDHNALARYEIDVNTKVSFPTKRTFYKKIIDRVLFDLRLTSELRVDEAGHPFLWVTTIRKP